ncbi:hypothetical protein D9619_011220 [Psilocybe cf. subviscida]|uniref:Uncharacterized protein n=1 Tax=Psilocybe cf. subviscida TaxID=2480587 RepID=A0A8H5BJN7_9AGAR|nr:hypothetical protein D9619_011220 [Psilocybe cf. subviscida]
MKALSLSLLATALSASISTVVGKVIPSPRDLFSSPPLMMERELGMGIPTTGDLIPSLGLNSLVDSTPLGSILSSSSLDSQFVRRGDSNTPSGSGASTPGDAAANESKLDDATKELNININNVNANTNTNTNAQPNGGSERKDGNNNNEADLSDLQYLNYNLFVEQFLVSFFEHGQRKYSEADFTGAGFPGWVRGRYQQILEHEKAHKEFLASAIAGSGAQPVLPCRYEFNDANVHDFVAISAALTTIASSSYVGSLQCFNNRAYITTSASILSVESRQTSWINGAVRKINPWNTAFETPLTPNEVVTLFLSFMDFDTCPQENRDRLPPNFRPYPVLTLAPRLVPGEEAEISFPYPGGLGPDEHLYLAFLVGIETIFAPVEERRHTKRGDTNVNTNNFGANKNNDNTRRFFVQLPRDLSATGTVYFTLVRGPDDIRAIRLDDHSIVAGPAIAEFPFDSSYKPITW